MLILQYSIKKANEAVSSMMLKSAMEVMEGTFCLQNLLFNLGYVSIWYAEVHTYFWNLEMFLLLF